MDKRTEVNAYSIVDTSAGYYWKSAASKLIVHENWDSVKIKNDIGLVKTLTEAPLTGEVFLKFLETSNKLLCFPSAYTSIIVRATSDSIRYVGSTGFLPGFGRYSSTSENSSVLRLTSSPVISNDVVSLTKVFLTQVFY